MRTDLIIRQLAELAGKRTREGMDTGLLELFHDLVQPRQVSVYRLSTLGHMLRWTIRHRADGVDTAALVHLVQHSSSPEMHLHRECWRTGDIRSDPMRPSTIVVPMRCDNDTQCLIELDTYTEPREDELRLIEEIQRFYHHLQALVSENERDALTRLLNRKSFDQHFLEMAVAPLVPPAPARGGKLEGDRRNVMPERQRCWLAVIDIDHFKRVNDTFGHLIGDEVLITLARVLSQAFRSDDRLYRFGGEEFVVMLNTPRSELTLRALERVRRTVEATEFPRVGHLTVSMGFTEVKVSDTPSAAFERADECVYRAKTLGRNQIVAYDSLLSSHVTQSPQGGCEVEFF